MARERISDRIVEDFLRRIGNGELTEGESVPPESALCASYGVSRSVVREAARGLAAKGFLTASQGSTTVIAPRHRWQVLDPDFLAVNTGEEYFMHLQEARESLEPPLARLAAQRVTAAELENMQRLTDEFSAATDDPTKHAALDIAFHEAIAAAAGNPVLASLHTSITSLGFRTRAASATVPGAIQRAHFWHQQILEAIQAHDSDAAEAAMRLHLRQVREELQSLEHTEHSEELS